jgi:hypothetical protein
MAAVRPRRRRTPSNSTASTCARYRSLYSCGVRSAAEAGGKITTVWPKFFIEWLCLAERLREGWANGRTGRRTGGQTRQAGRQGRRTPVEMVPPLDPAGHDDSLRKWRHKS